MGTPEEYQKLVETLQGMEVVPKPDSKEELINWMKAYLEKEKVEIKIEPGTGANAGAIPKTTTYIHPPAISTFSGTDPTGKSATTFDLWLYEVKCLMIEKTHSQEAIAQAIRKSLKGEAGRTVMRLGPKAKIPEILDKLTSVYGDVDEKESILSEFYGARQKQTENITEWSCRLEDILGRAIMTGQVFESSSDKMLHDMLWKGLRPDLKDITHYEREKYHSFDSLRVALRKIEKENQQESEGKISKQLSKKAIVEDTSSSDEIKGVLKQIAHRLENLETAQRGRSKFRTPFRGSRYRDQTYRGRGLRNDFTRTKQSSKEHFTFPSITCRRCGREGHIERGCRANTDINGKNLN
ncbi:uncharacterized protein LOC133181512 [Saccostrea echinata]|uniref:uncharacterized protein LOC133181512 n=1 Tax=Saccostrea echinata TaxID=191078 RepID=UPI002A8285A7|nr:uncharacterized protein LOC133181512 [Saccostrea echinata]